MSKDELGWRVREREMRTIVVAEDDAEVRRVVDEVVTPSRYRLFKARDGARAWELIRQHRPDVVLLDVVLPKLSGLEVLQRLRADSSLLHTRVVAISRLHEPEATAELRAAGADAVLIKPFTAGQVQAALDHLRRA